MNLKILSRAFAVAVSLQSLATPCLLLGQASPNPNESITSQSEWWPTYHGDYSGKHFSMLTQITTENVRGLSLAWISRPGTSTTPAILGGAPQAPPTPGRGGAGGGRGTAIKSVPLAVDGVLYLSTPGNAFALDARTGQELWHYVWQSRPAIGNRGMGISKGWVYLETPDNNLISLDAKTGKERWHKSLTLPSDANFSTSAPVVIRNHVIVGAGGDNGTNAGWVESFDTENGDLQWKWRVSPSAGEPGIESWPSVAASDISGGGPWQPPTYDPTLNLLYVTTGNPTPTYNGKAREGANLYTDCVVALNPDTGKLVWYYSFSPHDTHDWDSTQVPVLIDGLLNGQPRKLLAAAERNGYYFLLDRVTGKSLVVKSFIPGANGYKGIDESGILIPNADNEPSIGGSLVSPDSDGATNYPAPSFSPLTGLFYANITNSFSIYYATPDAKDPSGFGRGSEYHSGLFDSSLLAIDYRTGETKWSHKYPQDPGFWSSTYPGMLSTQSGLLFTGDPSGNFIAFNAQTGTILWHAPLGVTITNTPETFLMDGKQYLVVASGENLFAFYLQ